MHMRDRVKTEVGRQPDAARGLSHPFQVVAQTEKEIRLT
jgi:hypothetical protein